MITEQDVRSLVAAGEDAVLVLVAGSVRVVGSAELDTDAYRGALRLASRAEVVGETGGEPSEHECAEIAARLDTGVRNLGG